MSLNSLISSATGGVRSVYTGILGGLARQLPIRIGGLSGTSMPDSIPDLQYLGGPDANPLFSVIITAPSGKEGGQPISVAAFLDGGSGLSISAGAEYAAPFNQGLLEFLDSPKIESMVRLMGIRTVTQSMTSQVWQGSKHWGMTLNLLFIAQADTAQEVLTPIKQLMSLTTPSLSESKFLTAPGPRVRFKTPDAAKDSSLGGTVSKGVDVLSNIGRAGANELGAAVGKKTGDQANIPTFKQSIEDAAAFFDVIEVDNKQSISIGNFLHFESVVITDVTPSMEEIFDKDGQPMVIKVSIQFETHQVPTVENLDSIFPTTAASTGTDGVTKKAGAAVAGGLNGAITSIGKGIIQGGFPRG